MRDTHAPEAEPARGGNDTFSLRWRGRTSGPFRRDELEQMLGRREISPLHEVLCEGRWITVREWRAATLSAASAVGGLPPNGSALVLADDQFLIRWKGNALPPISLAEIERKLDDRELSMLHEVFSGGEWISLTQFFIRRNAAIARRRAVAVPTPVVEPEAEPETADIRTGARIVLEGVARRLKNGTRILDDINLVIEPNEFVALLGPSGSGKSTLMNAMTGRQRASHGVVQLNGEDFYKNSARYRQKIGHVPQKDIVHLSLTVQQTLAYAARLRLPASIPAGRIDERVAEVVAQTGLQERTRTRNSDLSGGQLKRVSLGVELLSDPELLFLDEATSGLDAGTEARMMSLFRELADHGRTVVCITHNLENVSLCDLVALLSGGRLVYYGPTADLAPYLGVEKLSQIYDQLETKTPEEWAALYIASPYYGQYVAGRLAASASHIPSPPTWPATVGMLKQFLILTRRYLAVTVQDRRNLSLLLLQAPVIACLLGVVFQGKSFDVPAGPPDFRKTVSFLMVISAIWFGCINAAREIVKELPIYLRERAVGLSLASYLGSKVFVLSLFCVVQCALLLGITLRLTGFHPDYGMQAGALLLTSLAGMLMGLLISALVKTEDKAMAIVPILLIPQVIFSGAILSLSQTAETIARWTIVAFWSFNAMLHSLAHSDKLVPPPFATFRHDLAAIGLFVIALTFLTAVVLKTKDPLK